VNGIPSSLYQRKRIDSGRFNSFRWNRYKTLLQKKCSIQGAYIKKESNETYPGSEGDMARANDVDKNGRIVVTACTTIRGCLAGQTSSLGEGQFDALLLNVTIAGESSRIFPENIF
jgi:hypothetical protein